jgi:hypothetical protein
LVLEKSKEAHFVIIARKFRPHTLALIVTAATLIAPEPVLACAVCMGDASSPIAPATNAAIFLLLGFVGSMLVGVASFAFYLFRRSRMPHPPHEQFLGLDGAPAAKSHL